MDAENQMTEIGNYKTQKLKTLLRNLSTMKN